MPPERLNLARYCLAGRPGDKPALIIASPGAEVWTYGRLEDAVLRLAEGFRRDGLSGGERLLIRMGNSLGFALSFFAANAAGAVPIPASALLTPPEVLKLLKDSGARFIACDGTLPLPALDGQRVFSPEDLERLGRSPAGGYADTAKDDPGYLVYTSGTSGTPKGVLHAQRAVWGRRPMHQGWYGIGRDDVLLHTGAFNWTYTMGTGLFDPFALGATSIVYTGPKDPLVWQRLMNDHGATLFASVPGIYRQLLRTAFKPPSSLRHGLSAGEALPPSILQHWREATGREIFEAIGMTEISTYISTSPSVPVKPGSPGKPQPGRAIRILEDGEIGVHHTDPGLMLGYWGEPRLAAEWFATGDAAHIDADGYVWHHGRVDDLMNAGGIRVSPLEVETVLAQHPDVSEAGVREWRVNDTLSIIVGFVVPKAGAVPSEAALLAFARERLAAYKVPKQITLLKALPRTANGKLIRKALEP